MILIRIPYEQEEGGIMIINNNFAGNIKRIQGSYPQHIQSQAHQNAGEFEKLLQENIAKHSEVKFSKHAESRLQMRNIRLSQDQRERINAAVKKAQNKGVKDSLVLMDNLAFVVNVKSKTVITAVNSNELKENVFTNIDGAVFI